MLPAPSLSRDDQEVVVGIYHHLCVIHQQIAHAHDIRWLVFVRFSPRLGSRSLLLG